MTVAATSMAISGFGGNYTTYAVELRNPTVNREDGTLSVDVFSGKRNGNSAIVENANYTMMVNGSQVASENRGEFNASAYAIGRATTLTMPVGTSLSEATVSVTIEPVGWEDQPETLEFTTEITPPVTDDDLSVSCSTSAAEVTVGDPVTVTASVTNTGGRAASVDVSVEAAGASESSRVEVPAGATKSVDVTFDLPAGEHTPTVAASVV